MPAKARQRSRRRFRALSSRDRSIASALAPRCWATPRRSAPRRPCASGRRAGAQPCFSSAREPPAAGLVVVDVPLLFETGGEANVDLVIVVSAPELIQRDRVLARAGMTEAKLDAILSRQMPDAEKKAPGSFRHRYARPAGIDARRRRSVRALGRGANGRPNASCVKSCSTRKRRASTLPTDIGCWKSAPSRSCIKA